MGYLAFLDESPGIRDLEPVRFPIKVARLNQGAVDGIVNGNR